MVGDEPLSFVDYLIASNLLENLLTHFLALLAKSILSKIESIKPPQKSL